MIGSWDLELMFNYSTFWLAWVLLILVLLWHVLIASVFRADGDGEHWIPKLNFYVTGLFREFQMHLQISTCCWKSSFSECGLGMDFISWANLCSIALFFPPLLKEFSINHFVEVNSPDKAMVCKAPLCVTHISGGAMAALDKMSVLH